MQYDQAWRHSEAFRRERGPIKTTEGPAQERKRPLRANASQIRQARPTEKESFQAWRVLDWVSSSRLNLHEQVTGIESYHRAKIRPKQNPKSEARNPKNRSTQTSNPKIEIRNDLVWNLVLFDHLDLFRISDFEFRLLSGFMKHIDAAIMLPSSPSALAVNLLDLLEDQLLQQKSDKSDDRNTGQHDVRI